MALADEYEWQAKGCAHLGSAFYAELCTRIAEELRAGGPIAAVLEPTARQARDLHPLRLLGGVHRRVLTGQAPELAAHYPSVGGDGDVRACWSVLRALLEDPPSAVMEALDQVPQTNEVARSGPLGSGLAVVAHETGLPLRLREIGSSAGLNLRVENYWFEGGGGSFGDPDSPIRFVDVWDGGAPPLDADVRILDRRGCDLDPLDPTTDEGRLMLLSYVWPDQEERLERLRAALDLAPRIEAPVDRAAADDWLEGVRVEQGAATVVQHSTFWWYLDDDVQRRMMKALARAGGEATPDAPLAWLSFEVSADDGTSDLRLTTWPGGEERLLARAAAHPRRIEWLV